MPLVTRRASRSIELLSHNNPKPDDNVKKENTYRKPTATDTPTKTSSKEVSDNEDEKRDIHENEDSTTTARGEENQAGSEEGNDGANKVSAIPETVDFVMTKDSLEIGWNRSASSSEAPKTEENKTWTEELEANATEVSSNARSELESTQIDHASPSQESDLEFLFATPSTSTLPTSHIISVLFKLRSRLRIDGPYSHTITNFRISLYSCARTQICNNNAQSAGHKLGCSLAPRYHHFRRNHSNIIWAIPTPIRSPHNPLRPIPHVQSRLPKHPTSRAATDKGNLHLCWPETLPTRDVGLQRTSRSRLDGEHFQRD
ncbi:hypothetical protein CC78DRAFT_594105 [Lojkania enalia]|uniref:Uncharacterized protein n=1 Tax=Lojkania enalia TaxID=147567 RepID=A0A9P4JY69_9PLEO|nr:hypothetical protein CC78DRAFT_594105 [Didymosphaeria enalia]